MLENIIVGAIVLAAAGFTIYRIFFRPSCGCGSDCQCCSGSKKQTGATSGSDSCNCGK